MPRPGGQRRQHSVSSPPARLPVCTLHTASMDLGPRQATEELQSQEHCSPARPALGDLGLAHRLHGSPWAHTGRWRRPGSSSPQELNSREDSPWSAPIPALGVGAARPPTQSWRQVVGHERSQVSQLGAPTADRPQSDLQGWKPRGEVGRARSLPGRQRGVNSCPRGCRVLTRPGGRPGPGRLPRGQRTRGCPRCPDQAPGHPTPAPGPQAPGEEKAPNPRGQPRREGSRAVWGGTPGDARAGSAQSPTRSQFPKECGGGGFLPGSQGGPSNAPTPGPGPSRPGGPRASLALLPVPGCSPRPRPAALTDLVPVPHPRQRVEQLGGQQCGDTLQRHHGPADGAGGAWGPGRGLTGRAGLRGRGGALRGGRGFMGGRGLGTGRA